MKKNYVIAASYSTIGELKELINDLPNHYKVNCCGEAEFYINVYPTSGDVCIDTAKIDFEEVE